MAQPMMHLFIAESIYGSKKIPIHAYDDFLKKHQTGENSDFVAGYLVHLLSDMIWYHAVRVPFKEEYTKRPSEDMTMNEAYYEDCELIEQRLYFDKRASSVIEYLKEAQTYTLIGLIEEHDVAGWRDKLLAQYDTRKNDNKRQPIYITEKHIYDYIEMCADKCIEYMGKQEAICRLDHI